MYKGNEYIDIISKEVHENVGGYPGRNHNMPSCCIAMRDLMKSKDEVLQQPPKGKDATLIIRYYINK